MLFCIIFRCTIDAFGKLRGYECFGPTFKPDHRCHVSFHRYLGLYSHANLMVAILKISLI